MIEVKLKMTEQEEKRSLSAPFDPRNYILQPDYEDDEFLIFTSAEFDKIYGDGAGFDIGFTEENLKKFIDIAPQCNALEIVKDSNSKYGEGRLYFSRYDASTINSGSRNAESIPFIMFDVPNSLDEKSEIRGSAYTQLTYLVRKLYDDYIEYDKFLLGQSTNKVLELKSAMRHIEDIKKNYPETEKFANVIIGMLEKRLNEEQETSTSPHEISGLALEEETSGTK